MIHKHLAAVSLLFWTSVQVAINLAATMRHQLRVRVTFEPNRLADERLHRAYELVVPVGRRGLAVAPPHQQSDGSSEPASVPPRNEVGCAS